MGGLLARIWAGKGEDIYLRDNNFRMGDINKLITLDSPHYGSFLADAGIACLYGPHSSQAHNLLMVMELTRHSLTEGAVEDLMTTSEPIKNMNAIEIALPSRAIAGDYAVTIVPIVPYAEPKDSKDYMVIGLPSGYFNIHNMLIQSVKCLT